MKSLAWLVRQAAADIVAVGTMDVVVEMVKELKDKPIFKGFIENIAKRLSPSGLETFNNAIKHVTKGYQYLDAIGKLISKVPEEGKPERQKPSAPSLPKREFDPQTPLRIKYDEA